MTGRIAAFPARGRRMETVDQQHLAWIARSFGRPDYLPLQPADVSLLSQVGEPVSKYPGTHLFKEGEEATCAYLIQTGEIDLYRIADGRRRVVARVGRGAVLGDIAMFRGGTYISSAQAVDNVRAFRLHRDRLIPELAKHPAVCMRWLVAGLRQLEETQRRVLQLMHKTVLAQVADLLVEESKDTGRVQLSQATIGTLLGASRQTVNEALARLRELKIVETGYRSIEVTDPETLHEVAAERIS
ncbi:MAG: Crp/Fnr family transcriptional regulator [Actinobacteria bacterium]|nr:Crp/Fnr family transcriptional regulator [Actinomycetota bacterium]